MRLGAHKMTDLPRNPEPTSMEDLENPVFLAWLRGQSEGGKIEPDDQDYDFTIMRPVTRKEADKLYRLALSKKLMRMYGIWKSGQN
jgi:hypothetical protein